VVRGLLGGLLCLTLLGSAASSAHSLSAHDGGASMELRAPDFPLAAIGTVLSVRFQKTAQQVRVTLQKPERSANFSSAERGHTSLARPSASQRFAVLPRRFLRPRHMVPRASNDSADPLLAPPSLS
jgi:hypothetical protein